MKKLLAVAIVAVLGFLAWRNFGPPNMDRAARTFAELCEMDGDKAAFQALVGGLPARDAYDCVMDAESCAEATGCLGGLQVRENLRGVQRAFQ